MPYLCNRFRTKSPGAKKEFFEKIIIKQTGSNEKRECWMVKTIRYLPSREEKRNRQFSETRKTEKHPDRTNVRGSNPAEGTIIHWRV